MRPIRLPANQPPSAHRGGDRVRAFRGLPPLADPCRGEDWVAATAPSPVDSAEGLTVLPDGRVLRDAVRADPLGWLGPDHLRRFGGDPRLQVTLVDTGEGLPLHAHRDAGPQLWAVLEAGPGAAVQLGFARDVDGDELATWVGDQKVQTMLAEVNPLPVRPGDVVTVPAGCPHAAGPELLLACLRPARGPAIALEHETSGRPDPGPAAGPNGPDGDPAAAAALTALAEVDRHGWDDLALRALVRRRGVDRPAPMSLDRGGAGTAEGEPGVAAEWIEADPRVRLDAGFCVLVVTAGSGLLAWQDGVVPMEIAAGDTVLVPYGAGNCRIEGPLTTLRCRPPRWDR